MRGRITGLTIVLILAFGLILGQAVLIQVKRASALDASPLNGRVIQLLELNPRGEILSSSGMVLAKSIPTGNTSYPYRRTYPLGRLVSDVVGYSSIKYGTGGLEYQYDGYLVAHSQPPHTPAQWLSPVVSEDDVSLTLNVALQQVAARALAGRVGAVVALNPKTGGVLAMYSNPTYNPNPLTSLNFAIQEAAWKENLRHDQFGYQAFNNVATQETYPPGSTFKVVTTAAIERYYPALATYNFPKTACINLPNDTEPLCNDGGSKCGGTITEMLPASCDPGYAFLGLKLGAPDLFDQATQFGFDSIPPIDLPGVVRSNFPSVASFADNLPGLAKSAIGQEDVTSTALQDALVASGVADGGVIMKPHLLQRIVDAQGNTVLVDTPTEWKHPLGEVEAGKVNQLMQYVAQFGTAAGIFLPEDDVAAKTGTAQTGDLAENTDDWMIAFAPATDPVVAAAVVVPYQAKSDYGATIAGPVMKCVIEAAIAIADKLPPDNTYTTCPS